MDESKLYENEVLQLYIQSGWNVLNKARTGINNSSLGSSEYKWTKRKCYEAAKSCSSKSELNKKYPTVYSKALKKGGLMIIHDLTKIETANGRMKVATRKQRNTIQ